MDLAPEKEREREMPDAFLPHIQLLVSCTNPSSHINLQQNEWVGLFWSNRNAALAQINSTKMLVAFPTH